jgi:hypothetical protein
VRVEVSPELSAFIVARVAGYASESPEQRRWASSLVADFEALPIYLGWTDTIGIRPDGEIVRWSTETEYQGVQPVHDSRLLLCALVAGAEKYPELRALLPSRPPGAVDCTCHSKPMFAQGKIRCGSCGGVGWLLLES